jgi:hypothetical protein
MKRYVPKKLLSRHGQLRPVVRIETFPPEVARSEGFATEKVCMSPEEPRMMVAGLTIVVATLDNGDRRHFGVEKAWIDSRLKMVVEGGYVNPRNEVAVKWPRVRA